jgi:hypothetical protein
MLEARAVWTASRHTDHAGHVARRRVGSRQHALKLGTPRRRWAADRGEDLWDRVPRDEIREHVSDYMGRARETIDDAVEAELKMLRRAIRPPTETSWL